MLSQSPINTQSIAFRFGVEDARANALCVPEMYFANRRQQVEYARGYESVTGPTLSTAQFTDSKSPRPIVEVRQVTYRGHTITLFRVADSLHGDFWGWRVGDRESPALLRHACVAHVEARAYIDDMEA